MQATPGWRGFRGGFAFMPVGLPVQSPLLEPPRVRAGGLGGGGPWALLPGPLLARDRAWAGSPYTGPRSLLGQSSVHSSCFSVPLRRLVPGLGLPFLP